MARLSMLVLLSFIIIITFPIYSSAPQKRVKSLCSPLEIENGKVRVRNRGRVARFKCKRGYLLFDGDKFTTCVRLRWQGRVPKCIRAGCTLLHDPLFGKVTYQFNQAVGMYTCDPGYTLLGHPMLTCNSRTWNASAPTCAASDPNPPLTCDFEEDTCGWTNAPENHFDWEQLSPPSILLHGGSGSPPADHTLKTGEGHFIMASAAASAAAGSSEGGPRARIYSPVFSAAPANLSCFTFYYHIYGRGSGELRVYLKPEGTTIEFVSPVFQTSSRQHSAWVPQHLSFTGATHPFQVVLESEQHGLLYGDVAVDDVKIAYDHNCTTTTTTTTTTVPMTTTASANISSNSSGTTFTNTLDYHDYHQINDDRLDADDYDDDTTTAIPTTNTTTNTTPNPTGAATNITNFMLSTTTTTTAAAATTTIPVTGVPLSPQTSPTPTTTTTGTVTKSTPPLHPSTTTHREPTTTVSSTTTHAPSTAIPTTHAPSTTIRITQAPSTTIPTTHAPSTTITTTHAPSTTIPTTHAPSTTIPTTQAPSTTILTTQALSTTIPTTQSPSPTSTTPPPSTTTPAIFTTTTTTPAIFTTTTATPHFSTTTSTPTKITSTDIGPSISAPPPTTTTSPQPTTTYTTTDEHPHHWPSDTPPFILTHSTLPTTPPPAAHTHTTLTTVMVAVGVCAALALVVGVAAWRLHRHRKDVEESSDMHYLASDEVQMVDTLAATYGEARHYRPTAV